MTIQDATLSGTWRCTHWYPSKDDASEDITENEMHAHKDGDDLVFESMPNAEGSYMFVRLTVRGDIATGSWHETTSPEGDFQSANYSGAGELLIDQEGKHMEGQWAGAGFDHAQNKQRIYTGKWQLTYVGE
jgi:hypothetical protein